MDVQKRIAKENPCQRIRDYSKRADAGEQSGIVKEAQGGKLFLDLLQKGITGAGSLIGWGIKSGFSYLLVPALFGMGFANAYFLINGTKRLTSGFAKSSDEWARDMTIKSICDELGEEFDFAARQAEEEKKKRKNQF